MKRMDKYESQAMIETRRIFTHVEQIQHEFGPVAKVPLLRGAIGAVLTNPFAGRYVPDILPMMDALQGVGIDMAERLRAAMDVPAERIEGYGKGAIVGAAGELEQFAHGIAPRHMPERSVLLLASSTNNGSFAITVNCHCSQPNGINQSLRHINTQPIERIHHGHDVGLVAACIRISQNRTNSALDERHFGWRPELMVNSLNLREYFSNFDHSSQR